jgi:hypothetical protein
MKRLFALLVVIVFAACSGDNGTAPKDDNNGGGGGGGGGTVTHLDSLRVEVVQNLAGQLDLWDGMPADSIAARAVNYLNHQPSIKSSGITAGTTTAWAVFNDGVSLIIPNNRNESAATDTLVDDASSPAPVRTAPQRHIVIPAGRKMRGALAVPSKGLELPVRPTFRAINAIGTCFVNPLPVLKQLLVAGHYANAGDLSGTIESMYSVQGNGLFYIDTHGGAGKNDDGLPMYALWTATTHEIPTLAKYVDLLHDGQLVVMTERGRDEEGHCKHVCHYGITAFFVAEHMTFGKNSLVFIDACSSSSPEAFDMQQAFKNQGASVYLGWTNDVDDQFSYRSMKYLVDRLLGVNKISPENPKQRAFNVYQVLNDMAVHHNLIDDPYKHALLTATKLKDDFGLLTPSIQFLSIDDDGVQPRLLIAGLFGTDPGEGKRSVTINGQELENISWYSTEIDCDIDETGANSHGTVVVKVGSGDDARKSNEVNLTEWKGEFTYERDDPGELAAQMTIDVRIVADIHSFRDEPGETPFETTVLFPTRGDTKIHMTTSGKYEEVVASCKDTYNFGEGGDVGTPFGTGNGKDGSWIYFGSVDTQSHTLQFNIAVVGVFKAGSYVRTRIGPDDCDPFNRPLYVTMAIDDCLYDDLVQSPAFRMQMQDDFTVPADDRGPCDAQPLIGELHGLKGQAKIKWGEMTPSFLPDPDAAR